MFNKTTVQPNTKSKKILYSMKKYIALLLVSGVVASAAYAQPNSTLSISLGAASPYSHFGSTDVKNPLSGSAKLGATLDISYQYKITKLLGIAGLLRTQMNGTSTDAQATNLKTQTGINWNLESSSWLSGSALVGFTFGIPITENFSIETRAMSGYSRIAAPDVTASSDSFSFEFKSATGAFSYLLGGGFRYNLSERLCVMANVDYFNAQAEFSNMDVTLKHRTNASINPLSPNVNTGLPLIDNLPLTNNSTIRDKRELENRSFTQSIETLNFTVGVGLRF